MRKKNLPIYNIEQFRYLGSENDFYANTFTSHLKQHHFITTPHKHGFFLAVLFTKGSGTHEIDFNTYQIKPGSIFMLFPGQAHNWKLSEDIEGYIFFHTRTFHDLNFISEKVQNYPFFCSNHNTPAIFLKPNHRNKIEAIFKEITEEYKQTQLMKFQKISSLISILYIELSRLYIPEKYKAMQNQTYLIKLRQLEDVIELNFKNIKNPGKYAEMINISAKHLNRICKVCLNKTVSDLISDRIILEAKRMMVHSKYTISEIAVELGYFDNSYFSRLFKKKSGDTPLHFLNKHRSI